jgi:predicted nucleic acid-binding Zn ribbon protein
MNDAKDAARAEIVPEHVAVYRRLRRLFGNPELRSADGRRRKRAADAATSEPYGLGRDPRGVGDVLEVMAAARGWDSPIARAELLASWVDIVGSDTAAHTSPVSIEDGVLSVRCDSTAWAQQLRLMQATVLNSIAERFPAAGVERAQFYGPHAPSWKHGPKAVPGRGPRDTYG